MNKAARTRQYIIEKSAPVFNSKGIAGTAMSDVMAVTGLAKGGLYGNFETKEDLAAAIVDYNLQQLIGVLNLALEQADTYKEKLFAFLEVFKSPLLFPVEGGCPILNFGVEADDTDPAILERVKAVIELAQSKIATIIRKGIRAGEFRNSFGPRSFSVLMFSAIEGGILIGRVLRTNSQMAIIVRAMKQIIEANLA